MATDKQIKYAIHLLDKAGYPTRYMDSSFKAIGAKMADRCGSVDNWLRGMNEPEISKLIGSLKGKVAA